MIYLDTCLVIYWVEEHSVFAPKIEQYLTQKTDLIFAVSHLVMGEALVMPLRDDNVELLHRYDEFFDNCEVFGLPRSIFIKAASLRAKHPGLKMPDALHLALAQSHQCAHFWTNDNRLQRIVGEYAVNIFE